MVGLSVVVIMEFVLVVLVGFSDDGGYIGG